MALVKIIGVGSPLAPDSVAWDVIERVESLLRAGSRFASAVVTQCVDRPGIELLAQIQGSEAVILVDAMQSGAEPGAWRPVTLDELTADITYCSTHAFGLAETLALGRVINVLPPQLHVFGVEVGGAFQRDISGSQLDQLAAEIVHKVQLLCSKTEICPA